MRVGLLVRVREKFGREREAAYFKITFLSRSFSFCNSHTDREESENEKKRTNRELHGVIFTRARVSLALLSLKKNGGLLVLYIELHVTPRSLSILPLVL